MISNSLLEIFKFLNLKDKLKLALLNIVMIINSFLEIFYIYLLFQFINYLGMRDGLTINNKLLKAFNIDNLFASSNYLELSIFIVFIVLLAQFFNILNIFLTVKFSFKIGLNISTRLFEYYMKRNFLSHIKSSSSDITNKVKDMVDRVISQFLIPVLGIVSRVFIIIPILIFAFNYNIKITFFILLVLIVFYFLFFFSLKKFIISKSSYMAILSKQNYKLIKEVFDLLTEIKLYNLHDRFRNKFLKMGLSRTDLEVKLNVIRSIPRSILEVLAVIILFMVVFYFKKTLGDDLNQLIGPLSVFFLILYKLLPAAQTLYINFSQLKIGLPAYQLIREDIFSSQKLLKNNTSSEVVSIPNFEKLEFKNVNFSYDKKTKILENINFKINSSEKIGLVGSSGSGKTTIINILLSLIKPDAGEILLNGVDIVEKKIINKIISIVPQESTILDGTILDNITLNDSKERVNEDSLNYALKYSSLNKLFSELKINLQTILGEKGIRLSGGQQQRIVLARALYKKPKLLILDEATKSLDNIKETEIINEFLKNEYNLTMLIISHNIISLKNCNKIIFLDKNKIADIDSFNNLYLNNFKFKKFIDVQKNK